MWTGSVTWDESGGDKKQLGSGERLTEWVNRREEKTRKYEVGLFNCDIKEKYKASWVDSKGSEDVYNSTPIGSPKQDRNIYIYITLDISLSCLYISNPLGSIKKGPGHGHKNERHKKVP
uniref:Ovule protein n=1 Tax=Steinernema glaseri TaxID=37863 RepID=A0A1I7Y5G8_9BILA